MRIVRLCFSFFKTFVVVNATIVSVFFPTLLTVVLKNSVLVAGLLYWHYC